MELNPQQLLQVAGVGQIVLAIGSTAIPKILRWKEELAKVRPLIKQMFWTYAGYIFVINLCFGFISLTAAGELLNGSGLALLINGFIAAYWISRVAIQFLYFDRKHFPTGNWHKAGEVFLVLLFIFLSTVYSYTGYLNC